MFSHQHVAAIAASILASIIVIDAIRADGRTYRLESCDAPETRYATCRQERAGEAASGGCSSSSAVGIPRSSARDATADGEVSASISTSTA
jgi:hypothetical protein